MRSTVLGTVTGASLYFAAALMSLSAAAEERIHGRVEGGGRPLSQASVTLWMAGPGAPQKLAETQAAEDGSFELPIAGGADGAGVLYLLAKGGKAKVVAGTGPNPAIALLATLGQATLQRVTINERTTVASVRTAAQFLEGDVLRGKTLGLRISAGNVANLVDLETGGLGPVIQDPLNS